MVRNFFNGFNGKLKRIRNLVPALHGLARPTNQGEHLSKMLVLQPRSNLIECPPHHNNNTKDGNDSVDDCAREDALFRQPLPQGRVMMADGDDRVYDCAYDDAWCRQRLAQASDLITTMTFFSGKVRGTRLSM